MAQGYSMRISADRSVQIIDLGGAGAAPSRPIRIPAINGARYQLQGPESAAGVPTAAPKAVKIRRVGQDLQLLLDGQAEPSVVLEGYYNLPANSATALLGQGPDGVLHEYLVPQGAGDGLELSAVPERPEPWDALLAQTPAGPADTGVGGLVPVAATGALGAAAAGVAAVAAVAGGGGGGGGGGGATTPSLTPAQALLAIQTAAEANNANDASLPLSTYASAGVTGVTSTNLAAINSVLNSTAIQGSQADTLAEVQAIVNAYTKVLNAADGKDSNTQVVLTALDFKALGVSGVTDAAALLLSDVIDGKINAKVDSAAELQELADATNAVIAYNASTSGTTPTAAQLNLLVAGQVVNGTILGVGDSIPTEEALSLMLPAIFAANRDGIPVTQKELAEIVGPTMVDFNDSKTLVWGYADASTTDLQNSTVPGWPPQMVDYEHLGIQGVTDQSRVDAVNALLAREDVSSLNFPTIAQLQQLVDTAIAGASGVATMASSSLMLAPASAMDSLDLQGADNSAVTVHLADLIIQPQTVQGVASDVMNGVMGGVAVEAQTLAMGAQLYPAHDFNHDGQLDLLVQQALTVQTL